METVTRKEAKTRSQVGQSPKRVEDPRFLTGKGRFIDDLEPVANIAHAAIFYAGSRAYRLHRCERGQRGT